MFKKFVSTLLCFLLPVTLTNGAWAQTPEPKTMAEKLENALNLLDVPEAESQLGEAISPLYKGYRAPFAGVHLSPAAVAFIYVELKNIAKTVEIEAQRAKKEAEVNCAYELEKKKIGYEADIKILDVKLEATGRTVNFLEKKLLEEEEKRKNVYLWTGLGFLAGVGLSLLTVYVVSETVE